LKLRLITGVLFFARQIKLQSVRYARVPGVLFFWRALSGQAFGFIFFCHNERWRGAISLKKGYRLNPSRKPS
jgi:hypothetical protein